MYGFTGKQISHLINRCVFFKIYFLKIIFVDVGSRDGTCFWESVAVFENRHRSCLAPFCVYVLWTGFSQDSFLVFDF